MDSEPPVSLFAQILNPVDFATLVPAAVAIVVLLIISGLISGSEVSFFSLTTAQLDGLKSSKKDTERTIIDLLDKPRQLLATILIGNNFVNVGIAILSTFTVHPLLNSQAYPIASFLIEVVVVTSLILLFGEVLPKIYATTNPMVLARFMAKPMSIARQIFYPLIQLLIFVSKKLERPTRNDNLTVDDLEHALELTEGKGTNAEEHKILEGIVRFGNTTVRQIMTPRTNILALEMNETFDIALKKVVDFGFSRIPVFEDNLDQIRGVIYIKDLLPYLNAAPDFAWTKLLREPFYVPESKKLDDLLTEFQDIKMHLAVVVDEFGGTSGLVSLEDIIEEIVGEISDEFDHEELVYSKLDNSTYLFEGRTQLAEFYRVLAIEGDDFESAKGDADTLAGFLLEISGKFPNRNDVILFNGYNFYIENIEERRIQRIKVTLPVAANP